MKSYRFSLYAYIVPTIFFIMGKAMMDDAGFNMFYPICMICIAGIMLMYMLFTVVYVNEDGITKKNLFGTRKLLWNDITRVSGKRDRRNREVITFVIWGHGQKIEISRAMSRSVDIIDRLRGHEVCMEGIPPSDTIFRQNERNKIISFVFLIVYIVVILFTYYQISGSMRKMNDAQERENRIRQQYNEILKEE